MSFQGDVSGTALADLLQSMARGRDGVLKLSSRRSMRLTLGLLGGALCLLPEDNEDSEIWRSRAQAVFAGDGSAVRMAQIARAQRIETLFDLLDAQEVHFRFTPGPVPHPNARKSGVQSGESGQESSSAGVHVAPVPVEGLLLEYARLCDEGMGVPGWQTLAAHFVPQSQVEPELARDAASFLRECHGGASLAEIADRLGWPLRQARICARTQLVQGRLRAAPREHLLTQVQHELLQASPAKAAARLTAWLHACDAGCMVPAELAVLEALWSQEQIQPLLSRMAPRDARRLALRVGNSSAQPLRQVEWHAELARQCPKDRLVALHLLAVQVRSTIDPSVPGHEAVMEFARAFHASGQRLRARALLRVAAARNVSQPELQLELGQLLLSCDAPMEAAPWILDAARHYLGARQPEAVLEALRGLCERSAGGVEARRLLTRARTLSVKSRLIRKNSLITMGLALVFASLGVVHYQDSHERAVQLGEIRAQHEDPRAALALLEARFPGADDAAVQELRSELAHRIAALESAQRNAWNEHYRAIQAECIMGDAVRGLDRALRLANPPGLGDNWPTRSELFQGLLARLERTLTALPPALEAGAQVLEQETAEVALLKSLRDRLAGEERREDLGKLAAELRALLERYELRESQRDAQRRALAEEALKTRQNILYNTARALVAEGNHPAALQHYEELLPLLANSPVREQLEAERNALAAKVQLLAQAQELCLRGEHAEARELLKDQPELRSQTMPVRIDSVPSGAEVRLADGTRLTCPLELRASLFRELEFTLTREGHAERRYRGPMQNLRLELYELPSHASAVRGRIEAPPLELGEHALLADRGGRLQCLRNGEQVWSVETGSLSGFAHTPLPSPTDPEQAYAVSADGEVWLVRVTDGSLQGPWRAPLPLRGAPQRCQGSVLLRLRDGSVLAFDGGLEPRPSSSEFSEAGGKPARLQEEEFSCEADGYRWQSPSGPRWLERVGTLHFALRLQGSLWISDGAGLRMWRE
ncbi:MAG: hypothetical protein RL277_2277 [Planctomycetota bacterium]|jgi:hypothetical protein